MKFFLLDGAGALIVIVPVLIAAMIVVILIEAGVMVYFKLNSFKKSFNHSLVVNMASLALGFALVPAMEGLNDEIGTAGEWLIFFITTVLVEGLLLMGMNKKVAGQKVWLAAMVMNVVTYLLLYLFVALLR